MPEPLFIEPLKVMLPIGFRDAIHDAARQKGQTASEFVRAAIRDRLPTVAPEPQAAGN